MLSTSYEFTARGKQGLERPRLMSGWTLAGFAFVVMIPLVMIFPKQILLRQASQQNLGDVLTVTYLTNLLKADQGNMELRILLAEHKIHLKQTREVPVLIAPVIRSPDPVWHSKGVLTEYKFLTSQYRDAEPGSAQRAELTAQRIAAFSKLAVQEWTIPVMAYLAGQADQLHERGLSALLYRKLSDSAAMMPTEWFAGTAEGALAEGDYELAAHLYFIARHKEHHVEKQRDYLLAGIRALMAGNLFAGAMQAMDKHAGKLENDSETLYALIQIARAANDQPRAVRYAKKLLHISWLGPVLAWLERIDLSLIGIANADAAAGDMPKAAADNIRPYSRRNYELGYQVFIENGNLAQAFRVAEAAVRQAPSEEIWHLRLAQTAEWTGKPELALREWRRVLRHSETREALLAVLRLAPSLNEYGVLLDAWKRVAVRQKLDEAQWHNIADLFEQTGRQREGIRFFEERYGVDHLALQLEIAARLAERGGNDQHASELYLRLIRSHGTRTDWVLKIANLHLRKGEYRKAYDMLQTNRAGVDGQDMDYWKLLAALAWQLQLDKDARTGYLRLASAGKLAREDFGRLIYLLGDTREEEKAALAELAYRRFGDRDMLLQALENYSSRGDMQALKRLFEMAAKDRKLNVSGNSRFYLIRAQYLQAIGDFKAARADFRYAAGIMPVSAESGNAMLWFLIDSHDLYALRELTDQIIARGDNRNPAYWGALAAAYQVLDQPSRAVAYYTRQLKQGGHDFLWLVNYADALEQDRQSGLAIRVRREAWLQLRASLAAKPVKLPYSPDMLAAARLAMLNHPGDPGMELVRSILRQDRLLEHTAATDRMSNELVLGWAFSKEQSSNAKAWLWRRYGQMLNRPLWADTAAGLAENDTEHLGVLLAGQADAMPMPVRHDVANAVGKERLAQSVVFDGLRDDPGNNEAHMRLSEDAVAAAGHVEFELRDEMIGALHNRVLETRIEMPVDPSLRVAAEYWNTRQSDTTVSTFGNVPRDEKVAGITLKKRSGLGDTGIALRRRNEFTNTTEAHVSHAAGVAPRTDLQLDLESNAAATETNELRVFGMRDRVSLGALYRLSKREYVHIQPTWARYRTQSGALLGSGKLVFWELGHHIRIGYPDMKVRLTGIHAAFGKVANASLALPGNVNIYGVCVDAGDSYRSGYNRGWRPSLDLCATHNDLSGQGYNAGVGLAGPVAGHDQLSVSLMQERGATNIVNVLSRELKLNYRYFY